MIQLSRRAWMPRLAFAPAQIAPRGDVLICIFLRGAADVLNMVVPHGEEAYYRFRPTLAIARPDDSRTPVALRSHDLDGFFGLHPMLGDLLPAWQHQQLAFVHACGGPDESRSHFEAMDLIERGIDSAAGPATGWIGRHLAALNNGNRSPLRAIAVGEQVQRALYGPIPSAVLRSITSFHVGDQGPSSMALRSTLRTLYQADPILAETAQGTLDVLDLLEKLPQQQHQSKNGARYPESDFGKGMRQVAQLVRAEVGLEVACLDVGGWDTHFGQGGIEGWMPTLLTDLGAGLAAFYSDMHDALDRTIVVVMSEFGRRVAENGSLGTDHGHGSMLMLLGGGVRGGHVYGRWPGLEQEQLVGPGDMAVTTDYRDILGELVERRLNNPQLNLVFPGYQPKLHDVLIRR